MAIIRKSPFKVDKIEDDPHAFGNRPKEVIACVEQLFNNRHIIISGTRGIGKSSLASQLQNLYKGDYTLAERCQIKEKLEKYLTCFYACDENTTLASLALDLIFLIEDSCKQVKTHKISKKKFEASLNVGVIKASLEAEFISNLPASIATRLINGLKNIYNPLKTFTDYKGINILIDELDQLDKKINFGHFLKITHEYLIQNELTNINFILAGQKGIYSHLYQQDPSVERIVKHTPISKLHNEECSYILNYASSKKAIPPFTIEPEAEELILKISSGFPYTIQLLGDATFSLMQDTSYMTQKDVLFGIEKTLKSDKNEKYYSILNTISIEQRKILTLMARYKSTELPVTIPFLWLRSEAKKIKEDEEKIITIGRSLSKDGYIIFNEEKEICQFNDELLRIFLVLMYQEAREEIYEEGKIDFYSLSDPKIRKIINQIEKADFKHLWEFDEDVEKI